MRFHMHTRRDKHTQTKHHAHTVSFSHANLTYESSWRCFSTAPPPFPFLLPSLFPSHCLTIHVTDGCCRQPQSYCCFLSLSGHLATARLRPASAGQFVTACVYNMLQSSFRKKGQTPAACHSLVNELNVSSGCLERDIRNSKLSTSELTFIYVALYNDPKETTVFYNKIWKPM